jgi:photosystem II stability/assembly factor-like uncharacterized protein
VRRVVLLAALAFVAGAQARAAAPPPFSAAIAFWDLRHGLAGGGSRLLATSDGGLTWKLRVRTRSAVTWLTTAGPHGAFAQLANGRALGTTDGGRTWTDARLGPAHDPSFANARDALALRSKRDAAPGEAPGLTATHDGGRTWANLRSPCHEYDAFVALTTPQAALLVCAGEPGAGQQSKWVYRSVDAGRHWLLAARTTFRPGRSSFGGISGAGYAEGAFLGPAGFGLLPENRGWLYVTRDGGRHWHASTAAIPDTDFVSGEGSTSVFSARGAYIVLRHTGGLRPPMRLLRTRDAGRTWALVHAWR